MQLCFSYTMVQKARFRFRKFSRTIQEERYRHPIVFQGGIDTNGAIYFISSLD